jgi:hypothetical protein
VGSSGEGGPVSQPSLRVQVGPPVGCTPGKCCSRWREARARCCAFDILWVCLASAIRMEWIAPNWKLESASWSRLYSLATATACRICRGWRLSSICRAVRLAVAPNVRRRDQFTSACSPSTWVVVRNGSLCDNWAPIYVFHNMRHSCMSKPAVVISSLQA